MTQLGQYPPATLVIAHFSDPHILAAGAPLFGAVDQEARLAQALSQLERSGVRPAALVFTGDLTDLGESAAYRTLRAMVSPVADRIGAEVVWVMGNHDERETFALELMGGLEGEGAGKRERDAPQDRVHLVHGIRIVVLDSTVPGYHHGELSSAQLDWLAGVLAEPAPHGTLLALHHPPIPSPIEVMAILELREQHRLAEVIAGTDVRGILAGHLHYSTHSLFAGVPVEVSAATCYSVDASAEPGTYSGIDQGQAFTLVHVYDDQLVHVRVPLHGAPPVSTIGPAALRRLSGMDATERTEAFSSKSSPWTLAALESE